MASAAAEPTSRAAEEGRAKSASPDLSEKPARDDGGDETTDRTTTDDTPADTDGSIIKDEATDGSVVFWDGPDDTQNPYNWPVWQKVFNCGLISAMTFVTPLASSMFAPGVPQLMVEFQSSSRELASFVVSVYVLGFAFGPLLFAPLSEIYGRVPVYHFCNVGFLAFTIGCALAPDLNSLIVFRFLSGTFGSAPLTNGGGTIADMVVQERRGAAMAIFSIGPLLGPVIGPVVGGFLAESLGWRWVFWLILIISGTVAVAQAFFLHESYAVVLLERKAARLRKETGNEAIRSKLHNGLSPMDHLKRGIVRPLVMLSRSPVCQICGIYVGVAYAYLYLLFTSITPLFMQIYGFSESNSGLSFIGIGIGSLVGVAYYSVRSDRYIKKKAVEEDAAAEAEGREKEGMKPEYRLPDLRLGALALPVGLFLYGWTAEYEIHWIVPIIGMTIVGFGNLIIFMALQMYLVDAFTIYAASALAANAVVRSLLGAVLPLAGLPMYDRLGVGWGNSVLGFIALALLPVPFLFIRYGEYLRKQFALDL